jgi:Alpha/beta hydrolase domain containing 18
MGLFGAPFGTAIDNLIGQMSHALHIRRAKQNTVSDLGQYLSLDPNVLFPRPGPLPAMDRKRAYLSPGCDRRFEVLSWPSQHVPFSADYTRRHEGEYRRNRTAYASRLHPRSGPRKRALIYVHGWLEPGPWPEQFFFLPFVYDALDVDVLQVQLPFHGSRNPRSALFHGEFFWSGDLVRSMEAMRQSVIDTRTLVAWLRSEGYTEVGLVGFSMGASIAMMLACLDPAPDYIVPIVGHLQLADAVENASIFWRMKSDLEHFGIDRAQRKAIFDGLGFERMHPRLAADRQLWVMAKDDGYVTASQVETQWRAWGRPPIDWIPGGHMTFMFSLPHIVRRMKSFHDAILARPSARGAEHQSYVS